jgi:putative SOS response-associated peptidase YedK
MPVVIEQRDYEAWLDPTLDEREAVAAYLVPVPPDRIEVVDVGPRVNDVRNDDPGCLEPAPAD